MSGIIEVSEDKAWVVAGWVFDELMRQVLQQAEATSKPNYASLLQQEDDGLKFVSLQGWSSEDVQSQLKALRDTYATAKAVGPSQFHSPEFFPGFMERFRELIEMIADDDV